MKISYADGRFTCHCSFQEKDAARAAGFQWNMEERVWFTSKVAVAARLRSHFDATSEKELSRLSIAWAPWTGRFVFPEGLRPEPFQLKGARWSIERNRSYNAFRPGLGKTVIAALVQNVTDGASLYICPPYMVENVDEEWRKWTFEVPYCEPKRASFGPFDVAWPPDVWVYPDTRLYVMKTQNGREILRLHPELMDWIVSHKTRGNPLTLFIDEAHRYKSEAAKRTKAIFELAKAFDKVVYLSGTPMPNRPIELWPVLSNSAPETIDYMGWEEYGRRYCAGFRNGYGWDFTGASNVEELATRVQKNFMYSLKKEDALTLPPITEELLLVGKNLPPKVAELDRQILKAFSPNDLMGYLAPNDHLATYRKELGTLKVPAAVAYIQNLLVDTDEALLVFAIHKNVIRMLAEKLKKHLPIVVTGDVDPRARQSMVEEFQRNEKRRVFLANIQAGGTGFTLTKATRVIFVEFSYAPADNDQARDRAHRMGQTSSVLVQYLCYKNSVDRSVIETILRKKKSTVLL